MFFSFFKKAGKKLPPVGSYFTEPYLDGYEAKIRYSLMEVGAGPEGSAAWTVKMFPTIGAAEKHKAKLERLREQIKLFDSPLK